MPPVDHLHVVLLRRDLRIDDQPALAQAAAACASLGDESRLIVVYIYDPELLRHPTSSTAHYLFIDDCLAELEAELAKRGSALFLRSGLLCGVLEMFTKMCVGMSLWSNRTCGVAAERARDEATRQWCAERGVKWNDLPPTVCSAERSAVDTRGTPKSTSSSGPASSKRTSRSRRRCCPHAYRHHRRVFGVARGWASTRLPALALTPGMASPVRRPSAAALGRVCHC